MALRTHRRQFIFALVSAATVWPLGVRAQDERRIPKVGVLWHGDSAEGRKSSLLTTLVEGFRKLGYIDGEPRIWSIAFPSEIPERFRSMAAELVALKVDVLMSSGNDAAPYAKNATATISVVAMLIGDPVGAKLVDNIARPGGNVSGFCFSRPS